MLSRISNNCRVHRVEPLTEADRLKMGCAASQSGMVPNAPVDQEEDKPATDSEPVENEETLASKNYPPPESFEVPLSDNPEQALDESIIRKHPPKRLQRLVEAPVATSTIADLEEKLAKAEIRRQKYLQEKAERIDSLGNFTTKNKDGDNETENHEDDTMAIENGHVSPDEEKKD